MPPPGAPGRRPGGCDNSLVGVLRLRREYFEARAFLFVCSGDKTCPCAEAARATMAPAAQQLALSSRCPALRALAPLSLVALWRIVRGWLA